MAPSEKNYVSNTVGICENLLLSRLINQALRFDTGKKSGHYFPGWQVCLVYVYFFH